MHEISLHISMQPLMNLEAFIKIKKKKRILDSFQMQEEGFYKGESVRSWNSWGGGPSLSSI